MIVLKVNTYPGLLQAQNEVSGPAHIAMAGTTQANVTGSTSQSHLAITKSETYALLGNPPPGTSSSLKSEKRSLASKLSGTLNRSNSGMKYTVIEVVETG